MLSIRLHLQFLIKKILNFLNSNVVIVKIELQQFIAQLRSYTFVKIVALIIIEQNLCILINYNK